MVLQLGRLYVLQVRSHFLVLLFKISCVYLNRARRSAILYLYPGCLDFIEIIIKAILKIMGKKNLENWNDTLNLCAIVSV